jgi:hypothetical protein
MNAAKIAFVRDADNVDIPASERLFGEQILFVAGE